MLRVSGQLDPQAGAVLSAALDPLCAPHPGTPDPTAADPWAAPWAANPDRPTTATAAPTPNKTRNRAGPAPGRPAPRRSPHPDPPPRRRSRRIHPSHHQSQIVVTIEHDTLKDALRGAGHTLDGTGLSPQTVRKLPCDASIIPIVLGSKSQPLDVGPTKRLVTPALLATLWARDKACTFPGCRRPPQWTDAHHVRHWIEGGPTPLLNLASR
jgi:Domain of unknown function (DUF222)